MIDERPSNRSFASSVANALRGLFLVFKSQRNARIHALATVVVCAAAWSLGLQAWQKVAIVLSIGLVLLAEAFNSAVERLCDRVTTETDPFIRDAKDLAAGAVLIASIVSVAVAVIVFMHHFINLVDASAPN